MLQKLIKNMPPKRSGLERPKYFVMDQTARKSCHSVTSEVQWYPPLILSIESIKADIFDKSYIQDGLELMHKLEQDDYTNYLLEYYQDGLRKYGDKWCYADIATVLLCLGEKIQPVNYLEIGVRRGRSVCAVASKSPKCNIYMFDQWRKGYAGMDNPGPVLVEKELDKVMHVGSRTFISGNSHVTLKKFFDENKSIAFDMITVDGDHSFNGAAEDLCDVLPYLKIGGAVVFDDIVHPKHDYLNEVWSAIVESDKRFASWRFTDLGYGVAFAIRKY